MTSFSINLLVPPNHKSRFFFFATPSVISLSKSKRIKRITHTSLSFVYTGGEEGALKHVPT